MLGILASLKCRSSKNRPTPSKPGDLSRGPARPTLEQIEPRLLLAGNGLAVTYFNNADLTGTTVSRTDATVNFNWANGSPNAAIAPDSFSARWTGQVQADKTQTYTFYTTSDDGVRLWINGKQIINNWTDHGVTEDKGTISLVAGQKYDIKLEYYDKQYGATIKLSWSGAATAKAVVPQAQLFSTTPVTTPVPPADTGPTPVPPPTTSTGMTTNPGLLGTYYDNLDYSGSSVARYDANVAFDWGTSSPHTIIGRDTWAARWAGQVVAAKSETYTFSITSDGGARLYIDGKLIINDWTNHDKEERSGAIALAAGRHDIKLEYFVVTGSAVMQLRWSSPSIAKQFIPSTSLFAAAAPPFSLTVPPVTPFTGFKTYTSTQVNRRPGSATDKSLLVDAYRISKIPIDTKGLNINVTDLVPGQKAWAYNNITIRNTEISDIYRTPGFHNDFIRIGGAAGRQDVPMNVTLENINIHDGQAIPILITDGDYDTIIIRNVKITNCTIAQVQINCQNVGSVKRVIVENCPGLHVAMVGRVGTIGQCYVRNSPGAAVSDSLNQQGVLSGVKINIIP
jgi:hypothetical protein